MLFTKIEKRRRTLQRKIKLEVDNKQLINKLIKMKIAKKKAVFEKNWFTNVSITRVPESILKSAPCEF